MKATCLVDNAVGQSSPLWGEHGLSFLIDTGSARLLLDTGASGTVLLHNMEAVSIAPRSISALVLSHGHYDHTGGVQALLERRPGLPIYAHPTLLRERFAQNGDEMRSIGLPFSPSLLHQWTDLHLSAEPQEIIPGVWTTGEIRERPEPEGRSPRHYMRSGRGWSPDSYQDDMSLVLETAVGPVLVCGCCHAGLLNTLLHVRNTFGRDPAAVLGGAHLVSADETHLGHVISTLMEGSAALYLNHCTGQRALIRLARAMGARVSPCPAGTVVEF